MPMDMMYFWLLQNNLYPDLMRGVDKSLSDEAWKDFPKTIIVHGDEDDMAPYQVSLDAFRAIGPESAQVFTVPGKKHAFDSGLYLGHPDLKIVEEAWSALGEIVGEIMKN
ncbi:hypothetical protein EG329_006574 [Mollisiaceae sp. DMI_Dod_QoI]|nr:hypothetical protein EG329_006574 [Helotiales sp. DMI_Dod_QoI]